LVKPSVPNPAPPPEVRSTLRRAASVILGGSMAAQALRLLSSLVLTRLLVPEAFGLMATVQALYFGLVMFSDVGISQSVVTAQRVDAPGFLGTATTIQLMRGAVLALVTLLLAAGLYALQQAQSPWAVGVYADPRLPPMVATFALVAVLQGAESLKLALAQRQVHMGALTQIELLSQVVGVVITVALAWVSRSVWSLVVGSLMASATRLLLSHLWLPGPWIRPEWQPAAARGILVFGRWIYLSSVIGFCAAHGEKILMGGLLPLETFGLFAVAGTLLAACAAIMSSLNGQLIFPVLSRALRETPDQVGRIYERLQRVADMALGLVVGLLFSLSAWVVWWLYDARYALAGGLLQWLSLGLLGMRFQVLEQMMFARSQPHWVTLNNALRAVVLLVGIPLGFAYWGVAGALIAIVVAAFAGWPVVAVFKYRHGMPIVRTEVVWPLALVLGWAVGMGIDGVWQSIWPRAASPSIWNL
jgi:O-antigen/teichoic acid export membrane protein